MIGKVTRVLARPRFTAANIQTPTVRCDIIIIGRVRPNLIDPPPPKPPPPGYSVAVYIRLRMENQREPHGKLIFTMEIRTVFEFTRRGN